MRYHNDSALVADLFKYNILEIITHRANWELKKLEKLDCEGLYHIKIDLDEINKNCETATITPGAQISLVLMYNTRVFILRFD